MQWSTLESRFFAGESGESKSTISSLATEGIGQPTWGLKRKIKGKLFCPRSECPSVEKGGYALDSICSLDSLHLGLPTSLAWAEKACLSWKGEADFCLLALSFLIFQLQPNFRVGLR